MRGAAMTPSVLNRPASPDTLISLLQRDDQDLTVRRGHELRSHVGGNRHVMVDGGAHAAVLNELEGIVLILNRGTGHKPANHQPAPVAHSDGENDDLRIAVGEHELGVRTVPIRARLYGPEMRERYAWT